eukprot:9991127-Karenia_brevis.AAC.1
MAITIQNGSHCTAAPKQEGSPRQPIGSNKAHSQRPLGGQRAPLRGEWTQVVLPHVWPRMGQGETG